VNQPAGRRLWAVLELLGRQIVDRDGHLAGKVDDLELELPDEADGLPVVTAILSGPGALAGQIGGAMGRRIAAAEQRLLSSGSPPSRIGFDQVLRVDHQVEVARSAAELDSHRGDRWVGDMILAKIPGASHATE
jgi:sporulation protein YlmC with PRC-barrel domain